MIKLTELKQQVMLMAKTMPKQAIIDLMQGIISAATIYRWISNDRSNDDCLALCYTEQQLQRELNMYKISDGTYDATPRNNKIVLNFQPHFYHNERRLWQHLEIRDKLIANRKKYLNKNEFTNAEILRGFKISGICSGFSHFSPLWLRKFIQQYNIKDVYDPCGGWGHRILGALNINYHYNDAWEASCIGAEKIINFCNAHHSVSNNDCTKIYTKNDACFTCPPYYNIEQYSKKKFRDTNDYQEFLNCMIGNSVANIWGVVINSTYKHHVQSAFELQGYRLIQTTKLGKTFSHFTNKAKQNAEWLFVYVR